MRQLASITGVGSLHIALWLMLTACQSEPVQTQQNVLEANCLQRGTAAPVCTCAATQVAKVLTTTPGADPGADAIARMLEEQIEICMISTGAYRDDVERDCTAIAPFVQKRAEACACAAEKLARDERVRDVLDRAADVSFPLFAQEVLYTCAYETGAVDALLANVCGGTTESPHCVCLTERFTKAFTPKELAGMSAETLRANASDTFDRCVVDAPHVKAGLMKACQSAEKKKGVCDCAVKTFVGSVTPGDVLAILQNGWNTESMSEMNAARRACGGSAKKRR
jgi:hypothetical protein